MTKYSKIWQNGTKKVDDKVIPWIAASKSSDQKLKKTKKKNKTTADYIVEVQVTGSYGELRLPYISR